MEPLEAQRRLTASFLTGGNLSAPAMQILNRSAWRRNVTTIRQKRMAPSWIVSGGGIEFIRRCLESVCGIPPEQVIGSGIKTKFEG
jgi:hypothetical protein